jgi:hypothetical protein
MSIASSHDHSRLAYAECHGADTGALMRTSA